MLVLGRQLQKGAALKGIRNLTQSTVIYSGHNRWSKISRDKGVNDRKKSQIYSKVGQEITAAARKHGSDPQNNLALDVALRKAKALDVPKDNINAALKRATAPISAEEALQLTLYEAIGPGQTPLLIECSTNNTNRTFKRIKELLTDHGCRMAPVAYMFQRKGKIQLTPRESSSFEEIWEVAVDANAQDVELVEQSDNESYVEVTTDPSDLTAISTTLSAPPHSHTVTAMELVYVPSSEEGDGASPADSEDAKKLDILLDELRDEADCENVWTLDGR